MPILEIGHLADVGRRDRGSRRDPATLAELAAFSCRNNKLAELALRQDGFLDGVGGATVERYGAARIGLFVGTSTSGILQTEQAVTGN